jgi:hypothetical protein
MTTLFGFLALLCWLALAAIMWDARGTWPLPEIGVVTLLGLISSRLWLAARRREARSANRAARRNVQGQRNSPAQGFRD